MAEARADEAVGRIILLNGTSSSGKSTLARALQAALDEPWLVVGIDTVVYALPGAWLNAPRWSQVFEYVPPEPGACVPFRIRTNPLGERLVSGMHAAVAGLASRGLDVIVDHVLLEEEWLAECRRLWAAFPLLTVGVRCPLAVLEQRERSRANRTLGQAAAQLDIVHRWTAYDVEVDTAVLSPDDAAARIVAVAAAREWRIGADNRHW
jgi:chloramphenicol 3-O phosphotransferase